MSKMPAIGKELYDHYALMSAQTHEALVKEYASYAVDIALSNVPRGAIKAADATRAQGEWVAQEAIEAAELAAFYEWANDQWQNSRPPDNAWLGWRARADAARAQGAEVAVKPLEWKKGYCDEVVQIKNTSFGGSYQIRTLRGEIWVDWPNRASTLFTTEEAAKTAVQADCDQCIRSVLTAPPAQAQGAEVESFPDNRSMLTHFGAFDIREGSRMVFDEDEDVWEDYLEVPFFVLNAIRSALATPPAPQPTEREKVLEKALREAEPYVEIMHSLAVCKDTRLKLWSTLKKARAALAGGEA